MSQEHDEKIAPYINKVLTAIERAAPYQLEAEVIASALLALKEDPSISIARALEIGLKEFDV